MWPRFLFFIHHKNLWSFTFLKMRPLKRWKISGCTSTLSHKIVTCLYLSPNIMVSPLADGIFLGISAYFLYDYTSYVWGLVDRFWKYKWKSEQIHVKMLIISNQKYTLFFKNQYHITCWSKHITYRSLESTI